jgi:oxygen-independent coproporphyrinogen III oxidase
MPACDLGRTIRHLYFHIPFCPKLCPYCCFYVETGSKNKTPAFIDALLADVRRASLDYHLRPTTIYFGGGTPTALLEDQLRALLGGLREILDFSDVEEFSMESNPATVRRSKAKLLKDHGVTRVSLGVQSWDDNLLKVLGRVHSAATAETTYLTLRESGIPAVNLDLMFSVPGQTEEQWRATLEKTIALEPNHISTYCLTYEEDTEYFRKLTGGSFVQDVEHDARLFEYTMDALEAAGFQQYEISNHARPGFESRHNCAYWLGADYLGFGPSAFSTVGLNRWEAVRDTAEYTRRALAGEPTAAFTESLSTVQRIGEIAAFRIRMRDGIPRSELTPWAEKIARCEEHGLLEAEGQNLRLTRRGKMLADSVAEIFVDA